DGIEARALVTLGTVTTLTDPAAARELLKEAERLARAADDDPALIDALQAVASSYCFQENHLRATAVLDEVAPLVACTSADRDVTQRSLRAWGMVRQGRFVEARAMTEPAVGIAAELGDLFALSLLLAFASQAAAGCGDVTAYDAMLRSTLDEAMESGAHLAAAISAVTLALQEVTAGRPEACLAILDEHRVGESEGLMLAFMYDVVGAAAWAALDDWPEARRHAQSSIDYARAIESVFDVALGTLIDALALRYDGELHAAESSAHQVLTMAVDGQFTPLLIGALDLVAGIALEGESHIEAVRIFAAAAAMHSRAGQTLLGSADVRATELETARQAIGDDAFAEAWDEGNRLDVHETIEYVTRARGERKRPSAGWDSLTPREVAVVRLATQGLTNPEIAEKLFVGRGTIKSHLSSIFTKLGVRGRAELAAEAARRDINDRVD
ncbi:MAG: hypothetical protein QOG50_3532, partial [Actinomycetota bacterium]|nr:hypothetical protein [Actinomycetota bacterium]